MYEICGLVCGICFHLSMKATECRMLELLLELNWWQLYAISNQGCRDSE